MTGPTRRALLAAAGLCATPTRAAGTLSVGIVSDPVTLDPAFAGSFFENAVLYNLHDTLLTDRPDGTVQPGLAESWATPDALTLTLRLRPGLTFHDGTALDADAVRVNLARYLDPATGSLRRGDLGPVARIAAAGRDVTLTLSEPYAALPSVLAGRAGMMVSPTALARLGADFAARAVGCGPWRLARWTRNDELLLEAFSGTWRGPGRGFASLSLRPIADDAARLENLRAGALDLIDAVPPPSAASVAADPGLRLARTASLGFSAFSFNCTRPPFADRRVRQAFTASVDPETIHRVAYFGTGRVAHGPLSPAVAWAYDPDFQPPRHDPARARRLLAEAGAAPSVTVTVTNAPTALRAAEAIQAQANETGFAVTLRRIDAAGLLAVLRARDFDLCLSPWSGRTDPDGNMFGWLSEGGAFNFSGYANPDVTDTLRRARRSADRGERALLYRAAQAQAAEDAPMLFLHFDAVLQAAAAGLRWTQYPDASLRLYDAAF